jgi:AcrR family transcriptional regulator
LATRFPAAAVQPRKQPRQARARATMEAILDAGAHILGERGWVGTTTNAVAERAGVSIGSLYQYFPNKLALVEAVRSRHFDEVIAVFRAAANDLPREDRIAAFVDGMIAVHSRSPAAHRVLMEEMPPDAGALAAHCQFEADYRSGCEAFFDANVRARVPHPHTAASVLAAAVAGVVHDAARQKNLGSALLRQHLIRLVESYLS